MSGRNRNWSQLLLGEAADRVSRRDSDSSSGGGGGVRTLLDLLIREKKMDGIDHRRRRAIGRWNTLKQRLRLKGIGCCGAALGNNRSSSPAGPGAVLLPHHSDDDEDSDVAVILEPQPVTPSSSSGPGQETGSGSGSDYSPTSPRMNLGAALAAERQFRQVEDTTVRGQQHPQQISEDDGAVEAIGSTGRRWGGTDTVPETPSRVSLMRLMAEAMDGYDEEREILGNDRMCCVCMERNKGAAFIPCGHTFCRVCTRELWLNRGSCPLCNRPILEILDIF